MHHLGTMNVPIHRVDVEIYQLISENFDLLATEEVSGDHQSGTINVCTKFQCNPSNSCRNISLKAKYVKLMVALEEKSGEHQCP